MVKSIDYEVVKKLDRVEIRRYPRIVLARVDGYGDGSFNLLFKFISGENSRKAKVAMTAPVISEKIAMNAPVISVFGSQFSPFAIQVIAVSVLGATSFQLGILAFLGTLPFLTLGLLVGVYVDRHRRRRIMIFADFGRAIALFLIPLSAVFYAVTMNLLYLVTLAELTPFY